MSGIVEKVARSICEAESMNPDDAQGGWVHWVEAAEAAIDATRDDLEFRISRIDLRPGDILVLKYPKPLADVQRSRLIEAMQGAVHGHRIMVLDGGLDIAVLTSAEIESRSAVAPSDAENMRRATGQS